MPFGDFCEPDVNWSPCADSTGYPAVLPVYYLCYATLYGATGLLYATSMGGTMRNQMREKGKLSFNSAMQMHVGIITFSIAGCIRGVSLASQEPRIHPLPILILLHLRHICVGYVTTVLVRHWASLQLRLGKTNKTQAQTTDGAARFVKLYQEGELIQAFIMFSFFSGTVAYGITHQKLWGYVERLELSVWSLFSAVTCWLVAVLGRRVYTDMKLVARSRAVLDYLRRVKYVVIGSSVLWFLRTVLFGISACLDKPLPVGVWVALRGGTSVTAIATALLYYTVIGSKVAAKAANATASESRRPDGVSQVGRKFKALARIVSSGANQFIETTIASIGDTSARVYVDGDSEEPRLFQRIASGTRWSARPRVDSGAPSQCSVSRRVVEGDGAKARLRAGTGDSVSVPEAISSETKQPTADTVGTQVGMPDGLTFDVRGADNNDGGGNGKSGHPSVRYVGGGGGKDGGGGGGGMWHTPVSPMTTPLPSPPGGFTDGDGVPEEGKIALTECEDDDAHSGDEWSGEDHQRPEPGLRQRSSWSRAHHPSSDDTTTGSSGESRKKTEEVWELEELEAGSFNYSSYRQASDQSSSRLNSSDMQEDPTDEEEHHR